jgi:Leucine-rich repeat (LRR) protein
LEALPFACRETAERLAMVETAVNSEPGKRPRRLLRFGLRTLLVTMTALCVGIGLTASTAARRQRAMETLKSHGTHFYDPSQMAPGALRLYPLTQNPSATTSKASWLQPLLGEAYFAEVIHINLPPMRGDVCSECVASLAEFPELEQVHMGTSQLKREDAHHFRKLGELKVLTVALDGQEAGSPRVDFDFLDYMPGLSQLSVRSRFTAEPFDGRDLDHVVGLKQLTWLELEGAKITEADAKRISDMRQLEVLNLSESTITDDGLAHIAKLPNLKRLLLSDTSITDAGLAHVAKLPELESLDLNQTSVTEVGLKNLESASKLKSLSVQGTSISKRAQDEFRRIRPAVNFMQ